MLAARFQLILEDSTSIAWLCSRVPPGFPRVTPHLTAGGQSSTPEPGHIFRWDNKSTSFSLPPLPKSINCTHKENILLLVQRELMLYVLAQMSYAEERSHLPQTSPSRSSAFLHLPVARAQAAKRRFPTTQ